MDWEAELQRIFRGVMNLDGNRPIGGIARGDFPAWDSLRHAELILKFQDRFELKFRGAEIIPVDSYAKLRSLVAAKMAVQGRDPGAS